MNELPWIVVHGAAVWVAALVGLVLGGAAVGLASTLGRVTARVGAVRRALGEPLGKGPRADGARVTLAGRLCRGAAVSAFPAGRGRREALAGRCEDEPALDVGGETVALAGRPAVLVGSGETGPRRFERLPWAMRSWMLVEAPEPQALAGNPSVVLFSVKDGDSVLAGGVLRRAPSPDGARDYRRPAAAWTLDVGDGAPGHGLAYAGMPPLAARAARSAALSGLFGLVLFGLVFVAGGAAAHRLKAHGIEAATPFHRRKALEAMAEELRRLHHHDARLVEQEVALARLRGYPIEAQKALYRHRELRRAADPELGASSFAARVGQARALAELGEMEEASLALETALADQGDVAAAIVHLLAGQTDRAARTLRRAAQASSNGEVIRVLTATADAIEIRATGDLVAKEHLQGLVKAYPDDRAPHFLLADLVVGPERRELLAHYTRWGPPSRAAMSLERVLAREIGDTSGRNWSRLIYPVWLAFGREEGHLWELVPALFEPGASLDDEPYARVEAAYAASALGDHSRAASLLPAGTDPVSIHLDASLPPLSHVIDLRGRARDPMPAHHGVWLAHPIEAWTRTGRDGAALAAVLDQNPSDADHAFVVGRTVESRREELSAWLRHGAFQHHSRTRLGRLAELENLRLFAEALGDAEATAELHALVERHRRALLRREILVPLAVLEEMVLDETVSGDLWP